MEIPPIHNMVVQWHKDQSTYFNIFENCPAFVNLTNPRDILPHVLDYDAYYIGVLDRKPYLYFPVKASTLDELKLEHPELFL